MYRPSFPEAPTTQTLIMRAPWSNVRKAAERTRTLCVGPPHLVLLPLPSTQHTDPDAAIPDRDAGETVMKLNPLRDFVEAWVDAKHRPRGDVGDPDGVGAKGDSLCVAFHRDRVGDAHRRGGDLPDMILDGVPGEAESNGEISGLRAAGRVRRDRDLS